MLEQISGKVEENLVNRSKAKTILSWFNNSHYALRKLYLKIGNVSVVTIFIPVFSTAVGKTCKCQQCASDTSVACGWMHSCSSIGFT